MKNSNQLQCARTVVLTVLIVIAIPSVACGATFVSNLSSVPDGGFAQVEPFQSDAQGFRTDGTSYRITGGAVRVVAFPDVPTGTPFAQILTTSVAGFPDVSIGSFTPDTLSLDFQNVTLHPIGLVILEANTDYFLLLGVGSTAGDYAWATTAASVNTGSGTVTSRTLVDRNELTPTTLDLMFQLDATAIPEPSMAALLSLGISTLILSRRRK